MMWRCYNPICSQFAPLTHQSQGMVLVVDAVLECRECRSRLVWHDVQRAMILRSLGLMLLGGAAGYTLDDVLTGLLGMVAGLAMSSL